MRILLTGASGFVGRPLTSFLISQKHTVIPFPRDGSIDLNHFDAVIHLAGEPLTASRWGAKKKEAIRLSREEGTQALVHRLCAVQNLPKVFISASAVGFYGNRGEERLNEESSKGEGFLSDVCLAWEEASKPLQNRGVRLVHARFGIVLGPNGGALNKMLIPYQLGLGGKLGSGRQWWSWIALQDLLSSLHFILETPSLSGAINIVAPEAIRQRDFSHTLAQILHRPSFFTLPAWLLRLVLKDAADGLLLSSCRVFPRKLLAANFAFHYHDLRSALQEALNL